MPPAGTVVLYHSTTPRRRILADGSVVVSERRASARYTLRRFTPDADELSEIRAEFAGGKLLKDIARDWGISQTGDTRRLRRLMNKHPAAGS